MAWFMIAMVMMLATPTMAQPRNELTGATLAPDEPGAGPGRITPGHPVPAGITPINFAHSIIRRFHHMDQKIDNLHQVARNEPFTVRESIGDDIGLMRSSVQASLVRARQMPYLPEEDANALGAALTRALENLGHTYDEALAKLSPDNRARVEQQNRELPGP